MKTVNYFLIGIALLAIASCASYTQTAPLVGISTNDIKVNVVADLDMANAKTVAATVTARKLFWIIPLSRNGQKVIRNPRYGSLSKLEGLALYQAKKDAGVDVILDPEFETERHSWFFGIYKYSRASIRGYGVKIKNYRQVKE